MWHPGTQTKTPLILCPAPKRLSCRRHLFICLFLFLESAGGGGLPWLRPHAAPFLWPHKGNSSQEKKVEILSYLCYTTRCVWTRAEFFCTFVLVFLNIHIHVILTIENRGYNKCASEEFATVNIDFSRCHPSTILTHSRSWCLTFGLWSNLMSYNINMLFHFDTFKDLLCTVQSAHLCIWNLNGMKSNLFGWVQSVYSGFKAINMLMSQNASYSSTTQTSENTKAIADVISSNQKKLLKLKGFSAINIKIAKSAVGREKKS